MATENYQINDVDQLLEQVGNLRQTVQNILVIHEDLTSYVSQIRNAWQSDTEDRDSYLTTLEKDLTNLYNLNSAVDKLNANLESFALASKQIANNG